MQIKQPVQFLQGFGIAAGLFLALGALSFFIRPGAAALGKSTAQPRQSETRIGEVREQAAPLPPDYLDICRAAGL
jgi:hypothetical protein